MLRIGSMLSPTTRMAVVPSQAAEIDGLRQNLLKNPFIPHHQQDFGGVGRAKDFHHLVANPFARQILQVFGGQPARRQRIPVGRFAAMGRPETKETQDTEIILGNAVARPADELDVAVRQIEQAVERIVDRAVAGRAQCIEREIAAPRICNPVAAEHDTGVPPVGRDVFSQRGDLESAIARQGRYRAVIDAGGDGSDARFAE